MSTAWTPNVYEYDTAQYEGVLHNNYMCAFYASQHLFPLILKTAPGKATGGLILNITSGASHLTGTFQQAYRTAKLATNRLSQRIGEAHADQGIVCVALHPGAVSTPGVEKVLPEHMKSSKFVFPYRYNWIAFNAFGRAFVS